MITILQVLVSGIILCPLILFIILFAIGRKRKKSAAKSFGFAADFTTFVLFFSVPLSISSLWGMDYNSLVFVIALFIAIIFTYIDWRNKKELEIFPLFKKVWRLYFLLLSAAYTVIWVIGLVQSILEYVLD
ncbi:DUF3397 domain-containing protein [Lysinibacillus yapensis]|uniref:DUF3397 domain-containing protein n=1 Tax=Ureibacillus yapensis TaxID=2304605 RepID=A0A396SEJ8_9BACL|nr:DUF3397 domain-containing protein [Lysinibacillus yapensis]RHW39744.1 DUF3397 domain-containing protein [Lysinibacillus yapensis]